MQARLRSTRGDATGLALRCGLSTAPVVVGNMGSRHKADYRVAGDAVRLAERLVHLERQLGAAVIVSEDTCGRVTGAFEVQELDRITLTGRERPLEVFEVLCRQGELDDEMGKASRSYQKGLEHYRRQEWAAAMDCFTDAGMQDLGYGFSRRYATRCWIHQEVPEFEVMARLSDDEMREVLRELDQRDLIEAMREMDADYKELFLSRMSQRVRRFMEEEMEAVQLMAYSREVVAEKYREIVGIALRLAEEGTIQTDLTHEG